MQKAGFLTTQLILLKAVIIHVISKVKRYLIMFFNHLKSLYVLHHDTIYFILWAIKHNDYAFNFMKDLS